MIDFVVLIFYMKYLIFKSDYVKSLIDCCDGYNFLRINIC